MNLYEPGMTYIYIYISYVLMSILRRALASLRPAAEEDHKIFVASVLNNFQLMARFTRFMRQAQEFLVKSDEDREAVRVTWTVGPFHGGGSRGGTQQG